MGSELQPTPLSAGNADGPVFAGPSVSELDQLKGQFLASLNHELRTPLSGVLGMVDLLRETKLDNEQSDYVKTIGECASLLLETLNSVLDYSALSAGNFRLEDSEFHLEALLASVAAEMHSRVDAKGLQLNLVVDPTLPETVIGDERYLRQLLLHLLRNAVKFTQLGRVDLQVHLESVAGGLVWIRVEVVDTGIGIPREKLKLIFESFRQLDSGLARNYTGLGLGLALSDKIVTLMGGEIAVSSQPGSGSTFSVRIPVRLPPALASKFAHHGRPREAEQAVVHRHILVVEDNKIAQQIVAHVLDRAGYVYSLADDGESAVEMAAERAYDLIFMDLQMPGMDGLEATRRIRELAGYETVPILAFSANYSDEHRALCQKLGMQGFVAKPIQKDDLIGAVRSFIG